MQQLATWVSWDSVYFVVTVYVLFANYGVCQKLENTVLRKQDN
jgi:hypothetical protein